MIAYHVFGLLKNIFCAAKCDIFHPAPSNDVFTSDGASLTSASSVLQSKTIYFAVVVATVSSDCPASVSVSTV